MATFEQISVRLSDLSSGAQAGAAIQSSGGFIYVTKASDPQKASIYTPGTNAAKTNGFALTYGTAEFLIDTSVDSSVDLYIMAPGGQFVVKTGVKPGLVQIGVDTTRREQVGVFPFSINDTTATTETDTGFDLPLYAMVKPNPAVRVTTIDATEDIDFGLLSSETNGDADGFIDSVSVGTLGLAKATLLASGDTMGALLSVLDSANAGDDAPEGHVVTGSNATSLTYTLSAGSDTAEGYVYLSYTLCN